MQNCIHLLYFSPVSKPCLCKNTGSVLVTGPSQLVIHKQEARLGNKKTMGFFKKKKASRKKCFNQGDLKECCLWTGVFVRIPTSGQPSSQESGWKTGICFWLLFLQTAGSCSSQDVNNQVPFCENRSCNEWIHLHKLSKLNILIFKAWIKKSTAAIKMLINLLLLVKGGVCFWKFTPPSLLESD